MQIERIEIAPDDERLLWLPPSAREDRYRAIFRAEHVKALRKLGVESEQRTRLEPALRVIRLTDAGKLREAAKVRSYLSAAYASAIRARQDARGLAALRALKITSNPARDLVTIDGASQASAR